MGNESSKAHTHGLHFTAKTEQDPSNGQLKKVAAICVEFDGLAFVNKKGKILFRPPFKQITGWGSSKNGKKISFQFEGNKTGTFAVSNAKVLERAILVRLDVFRSSDKFAANTVTDPSKKFPKEVILHVRSEGLVISDATQREKTRLIEFVMLEGWGVHGAHELVLQTRDKSRYCFFTEDASAVVRKLDDVAKMVTRSMTAAGKPVRHSVVEAFHAEDEEVLDITPAIVVENPFGPKVLPRNVALRILDGQELRILGVGSNKKVTIQFTSLHRFGHTGGGNISFVLTEAKGGHTIVVRAESEGAATKFCNRLGEKLQEVATGQSNSYNHAAPPVPRGIAQVGAIKARRLSGSSGQDLQKLAALSLAGQQMLAGAANAGSAVAAEVEVVDDFVMEGMSGRNAELLGLPDKIVLCVETAGRLSIVNREANKICAFWSLADIAGWQALDDSEILIVLPQGKVTFFVEDAEVLATVLEDVCVAFTQSLAFEQAQEMRRASTANPLRAPTAPQSPAPSAPPAAQSKFILFTIPPNVKVGQTITVKNADGNGTDMTVRIPPGVTAGQQIKVPLPATAQSKTIKFTIQKGMKAGQKFTVKNPDGKDISFVLPPGLKAGDVFEVKIPGGGSSSAEKNPVQFTTRREASVLTLTVPPQFNMKKGDRLQIKYKGKKMFVKIPPGVGPGQKFQCNMPTEKQMNRAKAV